MPTILLWLEAPLQSWGASSRFYRRTTEEFPTLSGVLGLICCARGQSDPSPEWLSSFGADSIIVDAYPPASPTPQLVDFHMVGSAYDDRDPWQSLLIPKTSEGKKAVGGGAKMTRRHYLQDQAFAVALEVPENLVQEVVAALSNPVWPVFLGRKSCPPTDLVFRGVFENAQIALVEGSRIAVEKGRIRSFRARPPGLGEIPAMVLEDVPFRFGLEKEYGSRPVYIET